MRGTYGWEISIYLLAYEYKTGGEGGGKDSGKAYWITGGKRMDRSLLKHIISTTQGGISG